MENIQFNNKRYKTLISRNYFGSSFFLLLFLSIHFLSFDISAQTNIEPEKTFYDKLMASNSVKKPVDFNLKGNIKSVIEISLAKNDSVIFYFNQNGLLEKQYISGTKELTVYTYENKQLKSIHFEEPRSKYSSKKYFNSLGFIEKEVTERINSSDTIHRESNYFLNEKYDELTINYKYNSEASRFDVVLNDFYAFTFNTKKQVISERNLSKHKQVTYGNTSTYHYDSISGNIVKKKYIDDCALTGSNSCGNIELFINYDNHNNIISKGLSDRTVRNSTWNYNYSYSAKYNENNDIIEEYYSDHQDFQNNLAVLFVKPGKKAKTKPVIEKAKPVFEYDYDLNGNWVKKYESVNNVRKLNKSRIIEYHN